MSRLLPLESRPHWVYELINAKGEHLYVGCTSNYGKRIGQHSLKPWFSEVVRFEADVYPDMESAQAEEKSRIELYNPLHNGTYTDHNNAWETRKRNMQAKHDADVPCGYVGCRQGCVNLAHERGLTCRDCSGCGACASNMPLNYYRTSRADEWQWIAAATSGLYASQYMSCTDHAALAFYLGKSLVDVVRESFGDESDPVRASKWWDDYTAERLSDAEELERRVSREVAA